MTGTLDQAIGAARRVLVDHGLAPGGEIRLLFSLYCLFSAMAFHWPDQRQVGRRSALSGRRR